MPFDRLSRMMAATPGALAQSPAWDPDEKVITRGHGLRSVSDQLSTLSNLATASLRTSEAAYRLNLPPEDLKADMAKSGVHMLETWRKLPEEREVTAAWAREVGYRRAEQGFSLDTLLRGYRIGGRVLFGAFMQWACEEGLPLDRSLALAGELWQVIDLYSTGATTAFREAEDQMSGRRAAWAGRLLDALLDGDTSPESVADAVRACGLAEHGWYAVLIWRPAVQGVPLGELDLSEEDAEPKVTWRMRGESAIGVAALREASTSTLAAALPARPGWCIGISLAVDGLAELGRARQLAELAVRTARAGERPVCLEQRLPAALLAAQPDLAGELSARVLGPVLALDQTNRDLLLSALAAWLATGGSAPRAAAVLFCPRNVVVSRIRQLERLTQRSLSDFGNLVELSLALEALQLHNGHAWPKYRKVL